MRNTGCIILVVALSLSVVWGQQPTPEPAVKSPTIPDLPPPMSQTPRPIEADDVVRITTNLVQIDAVVTRDNKQVTDLTADDFEVLEDGKVRAISNFSFVSIPPKPFPPPTARLSSKAGDKLPSPPPVQPNEPHRTIALVVDDLGLSFESMGDIRKQLRKFVNEEVQANDLIAIVRTGGEVGALQQFTNNKEMLMRAIDVVKWNHCSRAGSAIFQSSQPDEIIRGTNAVGLCSDPSQPLRGTLTALRFILQGMRDLPGRKSMVIFSENMPIESYEDYLPTAPVRGFSSTGGSEPRGGSRLSEAYDLQRLSELAVRESVVIYGVDTRGLQPLGPFASDVGVISMRPVGSQPFEMLSSRAHALTDMRTGQDLLAKETGGFLIKNSNDFKLKRIADDQSGYYLLGFRPSESSFDHRFHHISVRVKRPGVAVRTRSGFFGMSDDEVRPKQFTNYDRVNMALLSPFKKSDIEVHLTTVFADFAGAGPFLRSLIYIPGRTLQFLQEPGGWHVARLNLATAVFGDNGSVAQHSIQTRELRVHQDELNRIEEDGLIYRVDVPMPKAGAYQFRVAIRDAASELMGTARQFVDVPDMKKHAFVLSGITISSDAANSSTTPGIQSSFKMSSPAIRRFATGDNLWFGYVIYNARLDKAANQPSLTAEARLFRDGALLHQLEPKPVQINGNDLQRIANGGGIKLGGLPPGEYLLQVMVTEAHGKDKPRVASQWIDFEIVK